MLPHRNFARYRCAHHHLLDGALVSAAALLDKLEGVKPCGAGRWRARCPACDSRSAVLSIRETGDDVVLLHCFRFECDPLAITAALGLDASDLFPPRVDLVRPGKPIKRRAHRPSDVLAALNIEVLEVLLIIGAVHRRGSVTPTEYDRLKLALARLSAGESYCHD